MELSINLNTQVEVTLTAFGAECWNEDTKKYKIYKPKLCVEGIQ